MNELLKATDIASKLGVTTGRIYQLARDGVLPSVRIGRSIWFPRDSWESWLREMNCVADASTRPATDDAAE